MHIRENSIINRHINQHKTLYIIILLLFSIGFIVGAINSSFLNQDIKQESNSYILNFVESLKTKEINSNLLFREVIISNIKPIIYIWIFGLIIIGIPVILIYVGLYGYSLGFTVTSVINTLGMGKGTVFLITSLIPQEIIFIPLILFMSLNAILFSKTISNSIKSNLRNEIMSYTIIFVVSGIITIGISLFQTYVGAYIVKGLINIT